MNDFVVDFTQVDELMPLPQGEYVARIIKAEFARSREKGTPMLVVGYEVIDGEHEGRKLMFDNWMLSGVGASFTKSRLKNLGIDVDATYTMEELSELLIGVECEIRVEHQAYEGDTYARVRRVKGLSAGYVAEEVEDIF